MDAAHNNLEGRTWTWTPGYYAPRSLLTQEVAHPGEREGNQPLAHGLKPNPLPKGNTQPQEDVDEDLDEDEDEYEYEDDEDEYEYEDKDGQHRISN